MPTPEALDELYFSYNWNGKLNCNSFTTIRLANENKYQTGKFLKVFLNKQLFGFYRIIAIKTIQLAGINDWMALLDTGYNAKQCRQIIRDMYKNKPNINTETAYFHYILLTKDNGFINEHTQQ